MRRPEHSPVGTCIAGARTPGRIISLFSRHDGRGPGTFWKDIALDSAASRTPVNPFTRGAPGINRLRSIPSPKRVQPISRTNGRIVPNKGQRLARLYHTPNLFWLVLCPPFAY